MHFRSYSVWWTGSSFCQVVRGELKASQSSDVSEETPGVTSTCNT